MHIFKPDYRIIVYNSKLVNNFRLLIMAIYNISTTTTTTITIIITTTIIFIIIIYYYYLIPVRRVFGKRTRNIIPCYLMGNLLYFKQQLGIQDLRSTGVMQ